MIVIDYRQLLDKIDNPPYTLYSAGDRAAWLDECIATAHAFEAEPVKYGRWEVNGDKFYPVCNNCKYKPPKELIRCNALNLEPILTKYCPNCGFENGTRIYRGGDNNG